MQTITDDQPEKGRDSSQLFVLGMHRSGTSCVTRMLYKAGLNIKEDACKPQKHNHLGNYECNEVQQLNNRILEKQGGSWWSPPEVPVRVTDVIRERVKNVLKVVTGPGCWVLKDPRFLLTLDCWIAEASNPVIIGVFRHPLAVARSLLARKIKQQTITEGLALWVQYNKNLLSLVESRQIPLVCFDDSREQLVQMLHTQLGRLGYSVDLKDLECGFEGQLIHQHGKGADPIPHYCTELYDTLRSYQAR